MKTAKLLMTFCSFVLRSFVAVITKSLGGARGKQTFSEKLNLDFVLLILLLSLVLLKQQMPKFLLVEIYAKVSQNVA